MKELIFKPTYRWTTHFLQIFPNSQSQHKKTSRLFLFTLGRQRATKGFNSTHHSRASPSFCLTNLFIRFCCRPVVVSKEARLKIKTSNGAAYNVYGAGCWVVSSELQETNNGADKHTRRVIFGGRPRLLVRTVVHFFLVFRREGNKIHPRPPHCRSS